MYKSAFAAAVAALSLHASAMPAPQSSATEPIDARFCPDANNCHRIDLNLALPESIPDLAEFLQPRPRVCTTNDVATQNCWTDVATEGDCQLSISWAGDVETFRNLAISRETLAFLAGNSLAGGSNYNQCPGVLDPISNDRGVLYVAVKRFGYDLFDREASSFQ